MVIKNTKQIPIRCKGTSALSLSSLQNFQGNLKELRESEYKKLRKSIEKYGFRFPVFVWKKFILDGHQRIFVLKKMVDEGWSVGSIPIVEIEAENEREAKQLVLLISSRYGHVTDEGLYEFIMTSDLNFDELKEEIDFPEIDFKQFEQSYFTEEPKDAEPQIDRAEELNKKWQVKTGDLWQIGEHRFLCGDSIKIEDVTKIIGQDKTDLLITDPPYNVGMEYGGEEIDSKTDTEYRIFLERILSLWLNPTCKIIITIGRRRFEESFWNGLPLKATGCWVKTNAISRGRVTQSSCWEPIIFAGDGWPRERTNDVFDFPIGCQKDTGNHPCPKPLKLWLELIKSSGKNAQIISDPFLGSGTTMVACQNLNRRCRAMEIAPEYCAVILERMATAFPGIEIKRL